MAKISRRIPALWSGSDKKGPEMCARNGRMRRCQGAEDQDASDGQLPRYVDRGCAIHRKDLICFDLL